MRDIRVLHLESTDVCQAACPLCARETDAEFDSKQQHHLSMEKILQVFDAEQIALLDKMFMCGNYGDPAAGQHTLDICQKFRRLNPGIVLGMNTNGALRNSDWWHELGTVFNQPRDYVVFSIDGLEDTNSIYRKNVDWHKLMTNVRAFVAAGGSAHWDMLVYRHNQHQVETCKQLAQDLEFTWFRAKVSKRPITKELEFPVGWISNKSQSSIIDCHALKEQSIYIDSQGRISPCCWLGSRQSDFVTDLDQVQITWNTSKPHKVCASTCSSKDGVTSFDNQWQQQIQLR